MGCLSKLSEEEQGQILAYKDDVHSNRWIAKKIRRSLDVINNWEIQKLMERKRVLVDRVYWQKGNIAKYEEKQQTQAKVIVQFRGLAPHALPYCVESNQIFSEPRSTQSKKVSQTNNSTQNCAACICNGASHLDSRVSSGRFGWFLVHLIFFK